MENTKTITVYLVGYESDPVTGGISGFDWCSNKADFEAGYNKTVKNFEGTNETIYQGTLHIEVDNSYSGTEEEREEITKRIEAFLDENDWENTFNETSERSLSL